MSRLIVPGGYNDPDARGNTDKRYRRPTKRCATQPCDEVPGTLWSPYWCFRHNVERIDRISDTLEAIVSRDKADREREPDVRQGRD